MYQRRQRPRLCTQRCIDVAVFRRLSAFASAMAADQDDIVSERLRQLEDENAKLKRLLADAMLVAAALKDLLSKKW